MSPSLILGFSLLLLLGSVYFLLKKTGNYLVHRFLFFLVLAVSFQNLSVIFDEYNIIANNPQLAQIDVPFIYLIPPFYYFFIKMHFNYQLVFRFRDVLHLIPFLSVFAFLVPFYMLGLEEKAAWIMQSTNPENPVKSIYYALYLTQLIIYIYLVLRYLRNINLKNKTGIGYPKALKKWIRELSYLSLLYFFLTFIPVIVNSGNQFNAYLPVLNFIFYVLVFIRTKTTEREWRMKYTMHILNHNETYGSEQLSNEDVQDIQHMVMDYFKKQKNDMKTILLTNLANELLIPAHHLNEALLIKPNAELESMIQ